MLTRKLLTFAIALAVIPLSACKQELPKTLDADAAFGTIQDLRQAEQEKQLLYVQGADPYTKNWGFAKSYYLKIDDKQYQLHWDQAEKFAELKVGDKVNLHPTEYIACHGESDLKPTCLRLMRVYRSERRISPLQGQE